LKRSLRWAALLAALGTTACLGLGLAEELVEVKRYVCGNGDNEPYEECDDGNERRGDGCSPDCKLETGWVCGGSECVPRRRGSRAEPRDSDAGTSDAGGDAASDGGVSDGGVSSE
jgi:cysteine-rich repeat protein